MPVELEGKLNNYGTLTAKGTAVPFAEQPAVDLEIALRGQDMVNVSPYMIAATGYRFTAGLLDVDSRVVVKDGSIDAQNSLLIKKLQVKEVDKAISAQSAGSIGMPLDAALGILTDKNGSIELDVPIQGKLDEVDVGLQSVINIALQKATTVGLKTYLVYAFQPYGAAILLAEAVGGQMGKISLDPIVFDAGTSALTASHEDYLARLGKVMQERPQIVVQVCGLTATADLGEAPAGKEGAALSEEQAARMAELAQAREAAVKEHMISTYGVDAGRLVPCAPEHDAGADARPRVVLTI
jgi:hypothetical protein